VEKSNGNIVRGRMVREEDRNYGVRILRYNHLPDFIQVEVVGPDGVRPGRNGRGTRWELEDQDV